MTTHRLLCFDRLTLRLAAGMTLLVILPLSLSLYAISLHHRDHTITVMRHAAADQNRVIEATLRHGMLENDRSLIETLIGDIGDQAGVHRAMILDHDGLVRFATDPTLVGERISQASTTCRGCHALQPQDRERWTLLEEGEVLRTVRPIENHPACHACHPASQRLNGLLVLDVSLHEANAQLRAATVRILGGTILLAFMLVGGIGLVVRRLVLRRLVRLGGTARAIASGDLTRRAEVEGNDVIAALAHEFNLMADAVSHLLREVREQEDQLENVLNSLDDGLVVLDREYRVVATNHAFCRRFGIHPEMLRGRNCHEIAGCALPCRAGGPDCPTSRCLADGQLQRAVFQIDTGDPALPTVVEVYATPVFDPAGEVFQVVEIWRDITQRVREEERLVEIERMVSLGALASGFSHEMNTPLGSMLTCAEAILGATGEGAPSGDTRETVREHAAIIREQVLRCRTIGERFLRFSRGIPPTTEPIDLQAVVDSVVSLVAPTAREAGATITVEPPPPFPPVAANVELVQHVLLNLLVNAVQSFQEKGGHIALRYLVAKDVRIQVEDTGRGIPEAQQAEMFRPFRTSRPKGTGLGLFLSRNFLRRFGGDLRLLRSEPGAGACFEVTLRRMEPEA